MEAGTVHFHSDFKYYSPFGQFAYQPTTPELESGLLAQVGQPVRDQLQVHRQGDGLRAVLAGIPRRRRQFRLSAQVATPTACRRAYTPDTLNNYEIGWKTTSLNGHLIWNGATYLMDWKQFQTHHLRPDRLCPSAATTSTSGMRASTASKSNIDYKINDNWSLQAAASYTDARIISSPYPAFQHDVNERLPFVALLQLELERALRDSAQREPARATRSSTWPTRATCGTT